MKLFFLLSCFPVLAAAGFALAVHTRLSRELKLFSRFLYVSAVIQVVSAPLWLLSINNMPVQHVYIPLGFTCLALFYRSLLREFVPGSVFYVTIALFTAFSLCNSFFIQSIFQFDSNASTVESILIIILAISSFILSQHEIVREGYISSIQGLNWISSGLLLYYASRSLLYYYGDFITRSLPYSLGRYVWALHAVFSMVMYSFFIVGIWKSLRK